MKKAWIIWCMVIAMVFSTTGCNSIFTSIEFPEGNNIKKAVEAEASANETNEEGVRLVYSDEERNQPVLDYFQHNVEEKFKDLGGKQAFKIKDGHSDEAEDIEDFQIVDLLNGTILLYGYTTCLESSPNQKVHCAGLYNYNSGVLKAFHETKFTRSGSVKEDDESFFIQRTGSEIFIYDNGFAYLYSSTGVRKSCSDIETYLREQYPDAYSITVANAITDGNSRVYMEVSVEHKKVEISEDVDDSGKTEEELDEEADKLDDEVSDKVSDFILVYEVTPLNSVIQQDNVRFDEQNKRWKEQTSGKEYTSAPNAEGDMTSVRNGYSDSWGGTYIWVESSIWPRHKENVYQWKGTPSFQQSDEVINFNALPNTYVSYTNLRNDGGRSAKDMRLFVPIVGKYSLLNGTLGTSLTYTNYVTIERSYQYVTQQEVKDSSGKVTQEKKTETRTQSVRRARSRYRQLNNAFTETYRILDTDVTLLGNCVDGLVLCSGEDDFYWVDAEGDLDKIFSTDEEGYIAGVGVNGSDRYIIASGEQKTYVSKFDEDGDIDLDDDDILVFPNIGEGYASGSSEYDKAFNDLSKDADLDLYGASEVFTEKNILFETLYISSKLASQVYKEGGVILGMPNGGVCTGYLITSLNRGLVFYNPNTHSGTTLAQGSWYRSFKNGNMIVSIGFANGDNSYSSMDMAFARVYEYNLNDLCTASIQGMLSELKQKRQEEASKSNEDLLASEAESDDVKSMEEMWSEEYQDKHTKIAPETAIEAGETFNQEEYESMAASREAERDSSRSARIDEIVSGTSAAKSGEP